MKYRLSMFEELIHTEISNVTVDVFDYAIAMGALKYCSFLSTGKDKAFLFKWGLPRFPKLLNEACVLCTYSNAIGRA